MSSVTCLFQFKDVLNKELLKVLISIVDAKLFKTCHKQKAVLLCVYSCLTKGRKNQKSKERRCKGMGGGGGGARRKSSSHKGR